MKLIFVSLFFVFAVVVSQPALATETYECEYTNFSDNEGNHKERLELTFVIDEEAEKSYIVGNNGSNEVVNMDKGNGISFIEITMTGNVMTTTIDAKMNSVHSRNSVGFSGELIPSQYYGSCTKK